MMTRVKQTGGRFRTLTGGRFHTALAGKAALAGTTLAAALVGIAGCGGGGFNPVAPAPTPLPAVAALKQVTLVSDQPVAGAQTDSHLANAWGIAFSSFSTIWVADNHTGFTTVYDGTGHTVLPAIVVAPVPGTAGPASPTGQVFNSSSDFLGDAFILDTEDGTIVGWQGGTTTLMRVNNAATGAVYKGLAIASVGGINLLYATNFHAGTVDVFDKAYHPTMPGTFLDPSIPAGFAPFNIENIGGKLFVTYAMQNAAKHDDTRGVGNGFVDVFDTGGHLLQHFAARGSLNSPWGVAQAPGDFGKLSNDILVGDFGDGHINAFSPAGTFLGQVKDASGKPLTIDGLWALTFGNDTAAGRHNQLFFSAGPSGETHGRFGRLDPVP